MINYVPDNWIVVRVNDLEKNTVYYRLLSGWESGFLQQAEWRLNSGIAMCAEVSDHYLFFSVSGSIYKCHKNAYGLRVNTIDIFSKCQQEYGEDNFKMMPEGVDWVGLDWGLIRGQ